MSKCTLKAYGWKPQGRPQDDRELEAYRQLIREAIFKIFHGKRELLAQRASQPVSLSEIYLEVSSQIARRQSCGQWPYRVHGKRWISHRVNEVACPKYYEEGIPKVVAVGHYEPNPALFEKEVTVDA
jgi:hypothetical protein